MIDDFELELDTELLLDADDAGLSGTSGFLGVFTFRCVTWRVSVPIGNVELWDKFLRSGTTGMRTDTKDSSFDLAADWSVGALNFKSFVRKAVPKYGPGIVLKLPLILNLTILSQTSGRRESRLFRKSSSCNSNLKNGFWPVFF